MTNTQQNIKYNTICKFEFGVLYVIVNDEIECELVVDWQQYQQQIITLPLLIQIPIIIINMNTNMELKLQRTGMVIYGNND